MDVFTEVHEVSLFESFGFIPYILFGNTHHMKGFVKNNRVGLSLEIKFFHSAYRTENLFCSLDKRSFSCTVTVEYSAVNVKEYSFNFSPPSPPELPLPPGLQDFLPVCRS